MAALNPEAPPFYYYGRVPPLDLPFYTSTATQPFFDPPPSTPYYPSMSPSLYNYPNRSFLCSDLPYHPPTKKPFHGIHGNLHPTQQPVHPILCFPQPHTEAQARGGDGAAEEREVDGAAHPQPITPTAPNYKRFKAPRFYKNEVEDMPPSTPYDPSMSPSHYNYPNRSFLCSNLPYYPPTKKPIHGIHGNLHPTQQPVHPTLSFPQPHTEAQARGGDGAAEEREDDEAVQTQPITPTAPHYKRFKAPRFYKNGREDMQFQAVEGRVWVRKGSGKTTFMIKNIPYKYTEEMMLQFLDDHCRAENVKSNTEEKENKDSMSAYDFFYLPIDFSTRCSRGYAFVNFTSESGATRLRRALNGYKWGAVSWNRTCQISYARIQRKEELEKHFKRSNFYCGTEAYLPVIFHPYRNGSCNFQATRLGNLLTIARDSSSQGETNESTGSHTPTKEKPLSRLVGVSLL